MPPCTPRSVCTCYPIPNRTKKIRCKIIRSQGYHFSLLYQNSIAKVYPSISALQYYKPKGEDGYADKQPQVPCSSSTLHTLDRDDPPVTSVSDVGAAYLALVAAASCGLALGARLNGCACTSYGTIAGVRQLYGKYIPGVTR